MSEVIVHKNIIYCIRKNNFESKEQFYERMWLFINNLSKYKNNLDRLEMLTKIWSNVKYLNCKYDKLIMNEIIKLKLLN